MKTMLHEINLRIVNLDSYVLKMQLYLENHDNGFINQIVPKSWKSQSLHKYYVD
jgi:hypothetical protein